MASHTESNYNKFTAQGKGTLVGNWAEERALREFTNVGRTITKEHIPKRHLNFEEPIKCDKVFDNTADRIYGEKKGVAMITETQEIGTRSNPADALPKLGRKTLAGEAAIMAQIEQELMEKEHSEYLMTQERRFETSTGAAHCPKDYQQNTVGRKVMKTQDWVNVSIDKRDEQLIVEHGTWRRRQRQPDEELYAKVPKGDYSQQQPVTHWTSNVDRKNYYMSAAVGPNPFSRTSGLTQTADQTKAVSGFYGNINFDQEAHQSSFRKTQGTDLHVHNPYVAKDVTVSNLGELSARIIAGCKDKAPGNGLRALRVALRRTCEDGMIDPVDLKYGLRAFGVELKEDESAMLLKNFDATRCGKLSVNELLHVVRQSSWTTDREAIATMAYNKLDVRGNQTVTIADLEAAYNFVVNPEYQFGQKSGTQLVCEFLSAWETAARDGVINLAEFLDFYKDVSPTIMADSVFGNMVTNTWNL